MRSAFISDLHLGSRGCRADRLLDFLRNVDAEQLFLVGDIVVRGPQVAGEYLEQGSKVTLWWDQRHLMTFGG